MDRNRYIKISLAFLLIAALGMVVSCRKQNSYKKQEIYTGNINIVTDKAHENQFKLSAEEFKKVQNKVNINISVSNNIQNNYERLLKNRNNIQDIISIDDKNLKYIIDLYKDNIIDLTNPISTYKNNLISNRVNDNNIGGKFYSLPWDANPKLIVYRKDIFYSNGINPDDIKTWKDYIDAGKKLTKDTGKIFTISYGDNNDLNLIFANQLGISYFNSDKKLDFESEKWSRIFELEKEIYTDKTILSVSSSEDVLQYAESGKVLAFIADPYIVYNLMHTMPKSENKWGVMQLPAFEPGGNTSVSLNGLNIIVNKNSKNSKLALAFIKFALTDNQLQLKLLNKSGRFPVYKTAYSFKDMDKTVNYFNDDIWKSFIISQQGAYNIEYTKYFPKVQNDINNVLNPSNLQKEDKKALVTSMGKILEKDLK